MVQKSRPLDQRRHPSRRPETRQPEHVAGAAANAAWPAVILLSALLLTARIAYLIWFNPYNLGPDEAQYWSWLSHPQLSYLSKPPLTTWLMGLSTTFLGDTPLGVRLFSLLSQAITPILAFTLAAHATPQPHKNTAGWLAFGLTTTAPLVAVGGLLMSPDAILLPLWLAALYVLLTQTSLTKAANHQSPANPFPAWLFIGFLIGLAGLAKYTAAFFYPLLGLYLLIFRRDVFTNPRQLTPIIASGLLALAMQAPVILWNLQHAMVGVSHLAWQADHQDARYGGLATTLNFLLTQAAVLGPITLLGLFAAWATVLKPTGTRRDARTSLLLVFTLPIFAIFLAQTLFAKVQPNWPLLGTIPAFILVAVWAAHQRGRAVALILAAGIALNSLLSLALYDTHAVRSLGIPLRLKIDPTKDFMGWDDLGTILTLYLRTMAPGTVILTTRYQTAAELSFYTHVLEAPNSNPEAEGRLPNHPRVLYLNPGDARSNQYDLWPWPNMDSRLALYVTDNATDGIPTAVSARFKECHLLNHADIQQHAQTVRSAALYLCWQHQPPQVAGN